MNNNVAYLVLNYQNKLKASKNVTFQPKKIVNQPEISKTTIDNKITCNKIFDTLKISELDMLTDMSYLHKLIPIKKFDMVIDPISRLRNTEIEPQDFRPSLKDKLKAIAPECVVTINDNKENLGQPADFKKSLIHEPQNVGFFLANFETNICEDDNKKEVKIWGQGKSSNISKDGSDTILPIVQKHELGSQQNVEDNHSSSDLSDIEFNELSNGQKTEKLVFKVFSNTMLQFPDEVDPLDFFTQHSYFLGSYSEYIKNNYLLNSNLQMCSAKSQNGIVFKSLTIELTDLMNRVSTITFPFSLSYFIISLPHIVQLCFIYNYVLNYIKTHKRFDQIIDIEIFLDTLNKLCGIETARYSTFSVQSYLRKSLFGNANLNNVFKDNDENSGSKSQVIGSFEEKIKNYSKNKTMSRAKSTLKSNQINGSMIHTSSSKNEVKNISVSEQNIDSEKNAYHNHINKQGETDLGKSIYSNYKELYKTTTLSQESQSENISVKTSTDHKSIISEISESKIEEDSDSNSSIDSSDCDDSGDSNSLIEEEYMSKNPYEIKYSKVVYKFKTYTIKLVKPFLKLKEGNRVRELEAKDLQHIYKSDIDHQYHPFGDLVINTGLDNY